MPKSGKTGIARLKSACAYSMRGLKAAYQNEAAFRQEIVLAIILIPAGLLLGKSALEQALLIGVVLLVLVVELLNSAIEAVVDRVGDGHHELSGRAKDMGSAAVFISLALVVITWVLILSSYYL